LVRIAAELTAMVISSGGLLVIGYWLWAISHSNLAITQARK
jgi:hypothetical protein